MYLLLFAGIFSYFLVLNLDENVTYEKKNFYEEKIFELNRLKKHELSFEGKWPNLPAGI